MGVKQQAQEEIYLLTHDKQGTVVVAQTCKR
jgi:hypothetical protein